MAMDPNSPSYIQEEEMASGKKEKIYFESHLTRDLANTSVKENVPSLGIGQWIYKTNGVTNFTEADSINRKSLYTLSPSNDSEATISLNCKIPLENSNININSVNTFYNTFDLAFLPSFKINGISKSLTDNDVLDLTDDTYTYFILDFWIRIPSFNTSFFYMEGWNIDWTYYLYENSLEPDLLQLIVTNYFNNKKRLICRVSKTMYKGSEVDTTIYNDDSFGRKDLIFFIDNNTNLNTGEWHHIVIKATRLTSNFSKINPTPTVRIWFDDIKTFEANNLYFEYYVSDKENFSLLNDTQKINAARSDNTAYKFAFSNRLNGSAGFSSNTTYSSGAVFLGTSTINVADINTSIVKKYYKFTPTFFPDLNDSSKFYNSPGTIINYSDLFTIPIDNSKSIFLKDVKYSTITFPTKTDFNKDIPTDITVVTEKEATPTDIPISIDVANLITDPIDIPTSISIRGDLYQDILPISIDIGQDIIPVDPFEITLNVVNPFKSLEEVENYINKTYLGNKQAADDFQLLMKVTDTSYWPVEFSIDNNYHIHIKPDPIYLGVPLYASTNKQFLYGKYVLNDD